MRVFVTGASGWIGSAVVPELLGAGHQVVGLARSDASAASLSDAGAEVHRGELTELAGLRRAATAADGVIHLAYRHDLSFAGDWAGAARSDLEAIQALGEALANSGKPLVIASGTAALKRGVIGTEDDEPDAGAAGNHRIASEQAARALSAKGVRSSSVRLSPSVHGSGDPGFVAMLVRIAGEKGLSAYIGDGGNRWPAVHRDDAARLFRLALEQSRPGSVFHGVADEGIPIRAIAEVIGQRLDLPVGSLTPEEAAGHFGFLAGFLGADVPASGALTRERLGWHPTQPGLIEDLELGHYFDESSHAS